MVLAVNAVVSEVPMPQFTPPDPLVASAFHTASRARAGYETTGKRSVPVLCPGIGCVLPTPLAR